MKLKELYPTINDVYSNGIIRLIRDSFTPLFTNYINPNEADIEYIYNHSGNKYISPLVETLLSLNGNSYSILADVIWNRFQDKWERLAKLYLESEYNPLQDYQEEKIETPNLTETETPDITVTNLDKTKSKITETNTELIDDSTFGFNSPSAVNKDKTGTDSTNVVEGNLEDNVSDRTQVKTGTNTVHKTGNNRVETHGLRDHTPQEMIQQELELRKQTFIELLYKDLDKVLTLSIY